MGNNVFTPSQVEHQPFIGPRPQRFPTTFSARLAQFPLIFHYRYHVLGSSFFPAMIGTMAFAWYMQRVTRTPENIEKWKGIRKEWYDPKRDPEGDLY